MTSPQLTPVIAAVVLRDGRYLLGRRPSGKRHAGLWEFPGGKLLEGEDFLAAARRELSEELHMSVRTVGATLHVGRDPGAPFEIHFVAVDAEGDPVPHEHDDVGWFDPPAMVDMALAPADALFAIELREREREG